jgi:hypothetical protein
MSASEGKADIAQSLCELLMLWTAPTLRHQSAKGGRVKRTTLRGAVHGRG